MDRTNRRKPIVKNDHISFRITSDRKQRIQKVANSQNKTVSDFLTDRIDNLLDKLDRGIKNQLKRK